MTNLERVQGIYQAFAAGDVVAILQQLADDVRWEDWGGANAAQRAGHPFMVERRGKDGVAAFFASVDEIQEVTDFQVRDFLVSERQVVADVVIEGTIRATGRTLRDEELHLWTFDADGKVERMRHYIDTAKHLSAHELDATPAAALVG